MTGLQDGGPNNQTVDNDISEVANITDPEINLMDLFFVIWKRKGFVFLASVLPTLLIGLGLFLWPKDYIVSYAYNTPIWSVSAFKTLEDKFYSAENMGKLAGKLQENGFEECAKKLTEAKTLKSLKKYVSFQISPSFIKPSEIKDFEEFQKLQRVEGTLLDMRIVSRSQDNIRAIAGVCRRNFQQIMPMYLEKEQLNNRIVNLKAKMAGIEEARYTLDLELERKISTLEKLKSSDSKNADTLPGDIILQFNNIGVDKAYLPLAYQVQAAETQIIDLQEQIRTNKEMYAYYTDLLKLNERIFSHLEESMSSYYTLEQFHGVLTETLAEFDENQQQLKDYLSAYIKGVENKMAGVIPLVENPKVYSVSKGTVKKSAIVFAIALMMSIFASFLLEGIKKRQVHAS